MDIVLQFAVEANYIRSERSHLNHCIVGSYDYSSQVVHLVHVTGVYYRQTNHLPNKLSWMSDPSPKHYSI